jgi:hypothetical protein
MVVAVTGVAAADYIRAHSEVVGDAGGAKGAGASGGGGPRGSRGTRGSRGVGGPGGAGCAGGAGNVRSGGRVKLRPKGRMENKFPFHFI